MSPRSWSNLQSIFRMTDPLKIVICSLKSVKWLSSVQNDSSVVNTPASLNSPVVNTPGSLDYLVMHRQGSLDSPVMNTPGSRFLSVLWTSIRTGSQKTFWWIIDQGIMASQWINHRGVSTPWCILNWQVLLLTYLGRLPCSEYTRESQLPCDEYTGESRLPGDENTEGSRLPGSEYTGKSITDLNNFSNIRKNSKSCHAVSNGTRRRCLMKKTRVKISWHCPF